MDDSHQPSSHRSFFYEDLSIGQKFISGSHRLDEQQIIAYAKQFDPQPFHTDPEAAKQTYFRGLVASGWHTASVTMRLLIDSGPSIAGGMIGAAAEITWPKPTRPGDTLHVETEVIEMRPLRSRPDRGLVTIRNETKNQDNEVAQVFIAKLFVPMRNPRPVA